MVARRGGVLLHKWEGDGVAFMSTWVIVGSSNDIYYINIIINNNQQFRYVKYQTNYA
jgi:hypothetical protein